MQRFPLSEETVRKSPLIQQEIEHYALQGVTMPYKPPLMWAHGVLHWSLTGVLLYLGFDCLLPGDMMTSTNNWSFFLRWWGEINWGWVFLLFGTIGVVGAETNRNWLKILSVAILATVHLIVAGLFFANNPNSAGIGLYVIFAAQGYYLLYRYTRQTHRSN